MCTKMHTDLENETLPERINSPTKRPHDNFILLIFYIQSSEGIEQSEEMIEQ